MVVTGIFGLEEEDLVAQPVRPVQRNAWRPRLVHPKRAQIYEEKIAENETLVAVRARSLDQAILLRDLLSQAGARAIEIDAEAA